VDRRKFLTSTAVASAGAALAFQPLSAEGSGKNHKHHKGMGKYQDVVNSSLDCIKTGERCVSHCLELLGSGDKSMKDCFASAQNMLALCSAMVKVGSLGTNKSLVQKTAAACVIACKSCMEECKKHMDTHADCKACYESCKKCISTCKKLA